MKNLNKKIVFLFTIVSIFTFDAFSMRKRNGYKKYVDMDQMLITAVENGNTKEIKNWIKRGADLLLLCKCVCEKQDCKGSYNLVHIAIINNKSESLKCLLEFAEQLAKEEYFKFVTKKFLGQRPLDKILSNNNVRFEETKKMANILINEACKKLSPKNIFKFLKSKESCGCSIINILLKKETPLQSYFIKKCFENLKPKHFINIFAPKKIECKDDKELNKSTFLLGLISMIIDNKNEITNLTTKQRTIKTIITRANKNLDLNDYITFLHVIIFKYIYSIDDNNFNDSNPSYLIMKAFFQKLEREKNRSNLEEKDLLKLFDNFIGEIQKITNLAAKYGKTNLYEFIIENIFVLIKNAEYRFKILNGEEKGSVTTLNVACMKTKESKESFVKKLIDLTFKDLKDTDYCLKILAYNKSTPFLLATNKNNWNLNIVTLIAESILNCLDNSIEGVKKFIELTTTISLFGKTNVLHISIIKGEEPFKKWFEKLLKKSGNPKECIKLLLLEAFDTKGTNILEWSKELDDIVEYLEEVFEKYFGTKKPDFTA